MEKEGRVVVIVKTFPGLKKYILASFTCVHVCILTLNVFLHQKLCCILGDKLADFVCIVLFSLSLGIAVFFVDMVSLSFCCQIMQCFVSISVTDPLLVYL